MIKIELKKDQKKYLPGDLIEFDVRWSSSTTDDIEVSLWWSTQGRGSKDKFVAFSESISVAGRREGQESIQFQAPIGPYSFSGQLISLIWMVSANDKSSDDFHEEMIVIAPNKQEIILSDNTKLTKQ